MKVFIAKHVSNAITFILRSWQLYVGATCSSLHSDTILLRPNHTSKPVHTETEQYTHVQLAAPEDDCNSIRNMLSNKKLS